MKMGHAVYKAGVLKPSGTVELPENCEVEFEPRIVKDGGPTESRMEAIYEVMARQYETGVNDLAARHNEHQP